VLRDQFVAFLGNAIGCAPTINVRNEGTLYQLMLTGSNAAALASLLYAGSMFALPRKRAAATLLLEGDRNLRVRALEVVARDRRIIAAYASGCSAYEIATREVISADSVYYVLDRRWDYSTSAGVVCGAENALQQGSPVQRGKHADRTEWRPQVPNLRQSPRTNMDTSATGATP